MRIIVHPDGRVVVTVPPRVPLFLVKGFVESKASWIQERLVSFQTKEAERIARGLPKRLTLGTDRDEYQKLKEQAREILEKRVLELNVHYGFSYKDITVRNQKTRWGSCSTKGNLNFNYKVAFLPGVMMDYVIVHELCHLKEFNHSEKFWSLVANTIPAYKTIRREMKVLSL